MADADLVVSLLNQLNAPDPGEEEARAQLAALRKRRSDYSAYGGASAGMSPELAALMTGRAAADAEEVKSMSGAYGPEAISARRDANANNLRRAILEQASRDNNLALDRQARMDIAGMNDQTRREIAALIAESKKNDRSGRDFVTMRNNRGEIVNVDKVTNEARPVVDPTTGQVMRSAPGQIPARQSSKLQSGARTMEVIKQLLGGFKDSYAFNEVGGIPTPGVLGRTMQKLNAAAGSLGDENAQDWWGKYKMFIELPSRHEFFGSALTTQEQQQWDAAQTIIAGRSPGKITEGLHTLEALTVTAMQRTARELYKQGFSRDAIVQYMADMPIDPETVIPPEPAQAAPTTGTYGNAPPIPTSTPVIDPGTGAPAPTGGKIPTYNPQTGNFE